MAENDDQHSEAGKNFEQRLEIIRKRELVDAKYGYQRQTDTVSRVAWLLNVQPSEVYDDRTKSVTAAVDFYFLEETGDRFKVSYPFRPYLYVSTTSGNEYAVSAYLSTKYQFVEVERVEKEDLDLKNHLSGLKSVFLKISFPSTAEMAIFKKELSPLVKKNKERIENSSEYSDMLAEHLGGARKHREQDVSDQIIDMREHDLPYHMRVCIDVKIFVGLWYTVVGRDPATHTPSIVRNFDVVDPPDPVVCAFDIETTKQPLKFPESEIDQIMMISYMIDGVGFLIINREIVSEDIENFEYTPRPEFKGEFTVFNEADETALIRCFFNHLLRVKPSVMVTYNGDFFDWPFVETRATIHGLSMKEIIGFYKDSQDEFKHNNCIHMDAYRWVVRDSYLPMGSQNLKATTRAKLRYDPVELDPELMLEMARHEPKTLANYSVSDAVATYYLYMKYVHPFIFALCTIIPLGPDDVLRKGSGTLCEALLMVEAFHKNIIFPNKQIQRDHKMSADGHLLESETYVGGHVEALESGVFRADVACRFRIDPEALLELREKVTSTMTHALTTEMKIAVEDIENFEEVCSKIQNQLDILIEHPNCTENPKIYHLDVGAMYPNIILTNRLQPPAVVTEEQCLACVYNLPDATCKRDMNWVWRGELIPATRGEYERLMQQLEQEKFGKPPRPFHLLPYEERNKIEKKRVQDFCRKAYGKLHVTRIEKRTTTICERENGFYVDTVLAFRDRRYDYKALLKKAKGVASSIPSDDVAGQKQAQARVVLYESLQLAHKCILNSFYGYAMRKGSRWFSMEMAGIVCHTGSNIITEARQLVERIGRPLELDTDGIWCLLPTSFPENYDFKLKSGKSVSVSYPGAMLNELVKDKFTNDQYHTLLPDGSYKISSENSIFFEVDGPYLAMILPASKEEGKKLKKRYAVFNFDGSLAELKGFEVKRRGELAIIKHFQTAVFQAFLKGSTLAEIYEHVAKEADYWMDILFTKGVDLPNEELFELIGENRSMSKKLEEYGAQKSTSITTAKRLAEFLGDEMVKNAGLACKFIISKYPQDAPVTERTIPLAIFQAEPKVCCHYVRKWTKNFSLTVENIDIRELIDWNYYIERMGSCIQKIITIPAALQGIPNPVPRVPHPKWLENKRRERIELIAQPRITDMLKYINRPTSAKHTPSVRTLQSQNQLSAASRKRLQPPVGYDEESSSNTAAKCSRRNENDENSVSVFPGFITDPMIQPTNRSKRRKQGDDNGASDGMDDGDNGGGGNDFGGGLNTLNDFEDYDRMTGEEDENARDCCEVLAEIPAKNNISSAPVESGESATVAGANEFWKRPLRGKKFAPKAKILANISVAKLLSGGSNAQQSAIQAPERKSWTKDGFAEWMKFLKAKWRFQLLTRRREKDAANQPQKALSTPRAGDLSRTLARRWMSKHGPILHIIQITETKICGQYTVFALGEDGMRRFNLSIPRVFYVDDIRQRDTANCRLVQKVLPKMRPCANLYEYTVDDAQFAARLNDVNAEMCAMRINGIYETQVPLLYKAVVQLGAVCRLESVKNSLNVSLEQLHKVNKFESSYVDMDAVRLMYFYEFSHTNRSVFAFFSPSTAQGYVFIVNRSRVDVANAENIYKAELTKFINNPNNTLNGNLLGDKCREIAVRLIQSTSLKDGSQRFHGLLKAMKFSATEPIVFCVQTQRSSSSLLRDFKFLGEYPQIRLNVAESASLMNVLDWASMMTKRSIQHFFNSFVYLKDLWFMAQYVGLPVGNITEDVPTVALDIFYARQLQLKNYLLWASPSSRPDFGGKELEDWRLGNDWETASFRQNSGYVYSKEAFETKNIVVELGLGAVAVTALLQSSRIAEAEGTSESVGFASAAGTATMSIESALANRLALTNYDEGVAASGAMRVLKEVFHDLIRDIHLHENVFADQLVMSMHRWIRNPNSLLYNPAICTAVSTLMRKLCLLLVAEVNRLGGSVIHCSFTKIFLSTNRRDMRLATGFVESLVVALSQKPLFASLHVRVEQYSKLFLWIDPTNYAYVKCKDQEEGAEVVQVDAAPHVRLHLLMAKCLPEEGGCLKVFKSIVAGYLVRLAKKMEEKTTEEEFEAFCVRVLEEEVTETLFKVTQEFVKVRHQLKISEKNCPVYFTDPEDFDVPLEFVRCVCKILSMNPCIERNVENVRSQLMKILQMDDAAPCTVWSAPPVNLVLEYVYCKKCNQSADLNVSTGIFEEADGTLIFLCSLCRTKLSSELIEEMLIERVSKIVQSSVLQDYRCKKCNKIAMCYLAKQCECSNAFAGTVPAEEFRLNLKMVREVAKRHNLRNLTYLTEELFRCYE